MTENCSKLAIMIEITRYIKDVQNTSDYGFLKPSFQPVGNQENFIRLRAYVESPTLLLTLKVIDYGPCDAEKFCTFFGIILADIEHEFACHRTYLLLYYQYVLAP